MRLHFPETIQQAVEVRKQTGGLYIAGGTVVMVDKAKGKTDPQDLVALERVKELHGIRETDSSIEIGAACTFSQILACESVRTYCTALYQAASHIGGPQLRNCATLGGNYACGTPASDAVSPILVLNPKIVKEEDLIVSFVFSKDREVKSAFRKVGKRTSLAVSAVSMAVSAKGKDIRVAVGSCAPKVVFCENTSRFLSEGGSLESAKDILMTEISPIDDRWESAQYRREVCRNLLGQLYTEVAR